MAGFRYNTRTQVVCFEDARLYATRYKESAAIFRKELQMDWGYLRDLESLLSGRDDFRGSVITHVILADGTVLEKE